MQVNDPEEEMQKLKRNWKRILVCIIAALVVLSSLSFCGRITDDADSGGKSSGEPLHIITTVFPLYDWTKNILGTDSADVELTLLLDNGVDMHSYQPTVDDILKISSCDLFIYVGGESEEWVDEILAQAENKEMSVINLLDILGDAAKEEEQVEGMQAVRGEEEQEEETPAYDEHVWLSLRNAELFSRAIAEQLVSLNPERAADYRSNLEDYCSRLKELDAGYEKVTEDADTKTLVFADRFPFLYLLKDYGLEYYAAFAGCSAEAEASFETIVFLVNIVNELSLPAVMTIDGSDQRLAETIVRSTETKQQKILVLDSLQSVSQKELRDGISYLSVMEENLSVLKTALNGGE